MIYEQLQKEIESVLSNYGFTPYIINNSVIPDDSNTTLFVCSGMQRYEQEYYERSGRGVGSSQVCVRTNDLDSVGDGTHLSSFIMVGCHAFDVPGSYELSCKAWDSIVKNLQIPITHIECHPTQEQHKRLFNALGYTVRESEDCIWSNGEHGLGGYCCEMFIDDFEVGNLVNPLGHSVDVGFGLERMVQIIEGKNRVEDTSLFDQDIQNPQVRVIIKTLEQFVFDGIKPGNKQREYTCRRLIRKIIPLLSGEEKTSTTLNTWLTEETERRNRCIEKGRKLWKKHNNKDAHWWWDTLGVLPEELPLVKGE
jgi:alanyl-tRNA synthetase